ncbi:uncharacterized protein LOC117643456 [Thrips palmi]|uniref:Poly [ADP-ribose] polymerase n=1 Tax=Thrips palmi TaxID=161013 RepID=A0A6P8YMA6_THRPL|nr:uncharacterized protein LOC117643456 [Thrips palmi]
MQPNATASAVRPTSPFTVFPRVAAMALVTRTTLDPGEDEYKEIAKTFNSGRLVNSGCELLSVEKVHNATLTQLFWETAQRYQRDYGHVNIVKGWHGTKKENVASILQNNFDVSNTGRHRYGPGVSFSSVPSYAFHYCDKRTSEACMLLVNVLVSEVIELPENKDENSVPSELPFLPGSSSLRYDTSTKDKDNLIVFAKRHEHAFLPTHVVHFKRIPVPPPRCSRRISFVLSGEMWNLNNFNPFASPMDTLGGSPGG